MDQVSWPNLDGHVGHASPDEVQVMQEPDYDVKSALLPGNRWIQRDQVDDNACGVYKNQKQEQMMQGTNNNVHSAYFSCREGQPQLYASQLHGIGTADTSQVQMKHETTVNPRLNTARVRKRRGSWIIHNGHTPDPSLEQVQPRELESNAYFSPLSPNGRPFDYGDAFAYVDAVKARFADRMYMFEIFSDVMDKFQKGLIDAGEVVLQISALFGEHHDLLIRFNMFLPPGYRIEPRGPGMSTKLTIPWGEVERAFQDQPTVAEFLRCENLASPNQY